MVDVAQAVGLRHQRVDQGDRGRDTAMDEDAVTAWTAATASWALACFGMARIVP